MQAHGLLSAQAARLEALKARHTALSDEIEQEQAKPAHDYCCIKKLKLKKLKLKEEIEGIREAS